MSGHIEVMNQDSAGFKDQHGEACQHIAQLIRNIIHFSYSNKGDSTLEEH